MEASSFLAFADLLGGVEGVYDVDVSDDGVLLLSLTSFGLEFQTFTMVFELGGNQILCNLKKEEIG